MFFIEWRPDLYGEEISDKDVLNSRGFVAINSDQQQCDTERNNKPKLPCSPLVRQLSKSRVFKDWEVRLNVKYKTSRVAYFEQENINEL